MGGGGGVMGFSARGLCRHTDSSVGVATNVSKVPIVTLFFFRPHVPLPDVMIPPLACPLMALRGIVAWVAKKLKKPLFLNKPSCNFIT